jgi:uncharacterized protein (TIGR02300 family)
VAKPELGTKRVCPACGTKYYDLNRSPITCPNCGTVFEIAASAKAAPAHVVAPVVAAAAVVAHEEIERDAHVISLDAVEEEAEPDAGPDADEDEAVIPDAEDVEIDTDIEPEDAAPFLDEEEEEGDDVTDLLDVDAEDEDEV